MLAARDASARYLIYRHIYLMEAILQDAVADDTAWK